MPFGNTGQFGEEFVLGTGQGVKGKKKTILNTKGKAGQQIRQQALTNYMQQQEQADRANERSFLESRDPNVINPKITYGKKYNTAKGRELRGAYRPSVTQQANATSLSDMFKMAKEYPTFTETSLLAGLLQSPTKLIGSALERLPGSDSGTGNRFSQRVLEGITSTSMPKYGQLPYTKSGTTRAGMSESEKRVEANKYYSGMQRVSTERELARETLAPEFTSDTTFGDVAETALNFSPGSFLKAAKAGGKAALALNALMKAHPSAARRLAGAAGVGGVLAASQTSPDEAQAIPIGDIKIGTKWVTFPEGTSLLKATWLGNPRLQRAVRGTTEENLPKIILDAAAGVFPEHGGWSIKNPAALSAYADYGLLGEAGGPAFQAIHRRFGDVRPQATTEELATVRDIAAKRAQSSGKRAAQTIAATKGLTLDEVFKNPELWQNFKAEDIMKMAQEFQQGPASVAAQEFPMGERLGKYGVVSHAPESLLDNPSHIFGRAVIGGDIPNWLVGKDDWRLAVENLSKQLHGTARQRKSTAIKLLLAQHSLKP